MGVTSGLASKKFSGSVNRFGINRIMIINSESAVTAPKTSFDE
jgi:hypothetical protein